MSSAQTPEEGAVVGNYRLLSLLGSGGYGTVWKAVDLELGRQVAIKFLNNRFDADAAQRFAREARALGQLQHPNCVTLIDFGQVDDDARYLVTEFLNGQSLHEWSARRHTLEEILDVATQVAGGLRAAHDEGIVHRDVKPANVMIAEVGEREIVKVLDFGIAKLSSATLVDITKSGAVIGTPGYMSPEQLRADVEIGPATDQYSLGVVLHELIRGEALFDGDSPVALAMKHMRFDPPPLGDDVPPALAALVSRLLQKDASSRFQSMADVHGELRRIRGELGTTRSFAAAARPDTDSGRQTAPYVRGVWRARLPAIAATLAVAVVIAIGWVQTVGPTDLDEPPPPRTALVRAANPLGERSNEAEPPAESAAAASDECHRPPAGASKFAYLDGLTRGEVLVYFPESFDSSRPLALVALLREGGSWTERDFLDYLRFADFAEQRNAVLVLPLAKRASLGRSWGAASVAAAWDDIAAVRKRLCTDPAQLFVLGEGAGARAADDLVCAHAEEITAVVVSAHRYRDGEQPCESATAVPTLNLVQLQNRREPVEGGASCPDNGDRFWSLADHERHWHGVHGCSGEPQTETHPEGRCLRWECDTAFVSCRIDAGRDWYARPRNPVDQRCLGAPAKRFPYHDVVWDFMQSSR